jgi:outer membrane lipoprotein
VRWGGEIIKTEPGPQQTCFYLLSRPLDDQARPKAGVEGVTQGRFVACRNGFYDPEVFTRGRELTVTGTLHGIVSQKVGDFDYAYPRVEADVVYLWPKRVAPRPYYGPGFYDPFWGPGFGRYYGPGYGWGYPYWNQPRVIIVRPPHQHPPRGK